MKYALTGLAAAVALAAVALTPATANSRVAWRILGPRGPQRLGAFMWVRALIIATMDMVAAIVPITVMTITPTAIARPRRHRWY